MKYRLSKRRILQVLLILIIVVFAVRESRILWNVEGLEIFDLAFWGVNISDEAYTAQNLLMFWGAIIVLILLSRWKPPEVLSTRSQKKTSKKSSTPRRRKEREKESKNEKKSDDPFELINKKWTKVEPKESEK